MLELAVQVATLASVLVAIGALCFAVRSHRRQMQAQLFTDYTERFGQILESFPEGAWVARLNGEDEPPEASPELRSGVLRYLTLCFEEYCLRSKGFLARDLWEIWHCKILQTLRSPLFVREWEVLKKEFELYPEFQNYVENAQETGQRCSNLTRYT